MVTVDGPELITKYFPSLSDDMMNAFASLGPLYHTYNKRVNVVSRKDIDLLYLHHILHSLSIAKYLSFRKGSRILDLGTGGGFPGIPLAILFADCQFTLIDSTKKKIGIVNKIVEQLALNNVNTCHSRAENFIGSHDHVVSRAVASTEKLLNWSQHLINKTSGKNTYLFLKGGDLESELSLLKPDQYEVIDLKAYFAEPFFSTKKLVSISAY